MENFSFDAQKLILMFCSVHKNEGTFCLTKSAHAQSKCYFIRTCHGEKISRGLTKLNVLYIINTVWRKNAAFPERTNENLGKRCIFNISTAVASPLNVMKLSRTGFECSFETQY